MSDNLVKARTERARREIFKNNAFDRLKAEVAAAGVETFDEMVARRVVAIAGDVGTDGLGLDDAGRAAISTCDVVIHSAAAVSFDSPLDLAVEINLLGPPRIADTLNALGVAPHLVAVSTCYVAGNRRGNAPEALVMRAHGAFVDVVDHQDLTGRPRYTTATRSA